MTIPAPRVRTQGVATSVDGTRVAWYRYGRGERVVLFVPTWNIVDARTLGHQVVALEQHATVITFDPRGAGASDRPDQGYDFPLHVADAIAVLDANGIQQATLVTASRGTNTAVLLAAENPDRFDRLAAIAPYVDLDDESEPPNAEWLDSLLIDWPAFVVPFMHSVFPEPDSVDLIAEMIDNALQASPEIIVTQERELDWKHPAALVRTVTCPALLVHGDADASIPTAEAESIAAAFPNARLEMIPHGGHRPDIRTPELVNPLLLEFLLNVIVA